MFGGNKSGGILDGGIVVNIEENPTCDTPIIIGELYGGGNEAPYSAYGYNADGTGKTKDDVPPERMASPVVVYAKAFTSIGTIYGGGKGTKAELIGNPMVIVNEVAGGRTFESDDAEVAPAVTQEDGTLLKTLSDDTQVTLYPRAADATMGVIGTIFGGGNAAKVVGNTTVKIGSELGYKIEFESLKYDPTVIDKTKLVIGADVRGNIYGGGNNAEVTGNTNVVIGRKAE